jgi:glycosyltransferase involved in cell wall biosynthesis
MIVKNEEPVLERCLNSLRGLAEEIIIVDTGSTDATKEIASRFTDKIFDFKWIHDFSAARNYSFSKATQDYIYVADADEVIDDVNRQRFLLLKQNLLPEIEIVQMIYANQLQFNTTYNFNEEYRPKLYKRLREFRWVDPIHESVLLQPVIYDSDIIVTHLPLSNHAGRDFMTFQRVIEKEGKLSKKLFEMYAKELFISGKEADFLDAFLYYKTFSEQENFDDRERKISECVLSKCYRIQKDIAGLMKCALKNLADQKASSEVCYELGEYFFESEDYKEATIWYYNAAYETECELSIRYSGDLPLRKLSKCYKYLGNKEEEEAYQTLANDWYDKNMG